MKFEHQVLDKDLCCEAINNSTVQLSPDLFDYLKDCMLPKSSMWKEGSVGSSSHTITYSGTRPVLEALRSVLYSMRRKWLLGFTSVVINENVLLVVRLETESEELELEEEDELLAQKFQELSFD